MAHPFAIDLLFKSTALLLALSAVLLLTRSASASTRHSIWAAGFFALLLLPLFSAALPGWRVLPRWTASPIPLVADHAKHATLAAPADPPSTPLAPTPAPLASASTPAPSATPLPTAPRRSFAFTPAPLVVSFYLLGFLITATPLLLARLALRRLRRRATPVTTGPLHALITDLRRALRLHRPVALLLGEEQATMPMAWGLRSATILLPADAPAWSSERQRLVLLHELAHTRRRDPLLHAIARLLCALYWFHPLVWLAQRQLRIEAERACDDLVLAAHTRPSTYASELLAIATNLRPTPHAAAGIAMARGNRAQVASRIRAILDPRRNRQPLPRAPLALVLCGMAALTLCIACMQQRPTQSKTAPSNVPPNESPRPVTDTRTLDGTTIHLVAIARWTGRKDGFVVSRWHHLEGDFAPQRFTCRPDAAIIPRDKDGKFESGLCVALQTTPDATLIGNLHTTVSPAPDRRMTVFNNTPADGPALLYLSYHQVPSEVSIRFSHRGGNAVEFNPILTAPASPVSTQPAASRAAAPPAPEYSHPVFTLYPGATPYLTTIDGNIAIRFVHNLGPLTPSLAAVAERTNGQRVGSWNVRSTPAPPTARPLLYAQTSTNTLTDSTIYFHNLPPAQLRSVTVAFSSARKQALAYIVLDPRFPHTDQPLDPNAPHAIKKETRDHAPVFLTPGGMTLIPGGLTRCSGPGAKDGGFDIWSVECATATFVNANGAPLLKTDDASLFCGYTSFAPAWPDARP